MRVLMADFESLKLVSLLMKCLCMAPLMPVIYGGNYILHLVAPHSSQIHLELGGGVGMATLIMELFSLLSEQVIEGLSEPLLGNLHVTILTYND